MTVDVIILTDSSDVYMTQRTINTIIHSEIDYIFNIQLVDSGENNPNKYKGFHNYIHPESAFNYNKFLNLAFNYCKSTWVVISNDDISYERGWFTEMMKVHEERPDIESFSPKDPLYFMKYYSGHFMSGDKNYYEGHRVSEAIMGWCIVIKRDALEMIFPFDEQFDMYYQDNDYAERIKQFDIKHALVINSIASHLNTLSVDNRRTDEAYINKFKSDELKFRTKWQIWT